MLFSAEGLRKKILSKYVVLSPYLQFVFIHKISVKDFFLATKGELWDKEAMEQISMKKLQQNQL